MTSPGMPQPKREHPKEKISLHPRNRHRERYDFKLLIDSCQDLAQYVRLNPYGDESIDFFNPEAVLTLNKALLMHYYGLYNWDIPQGYLCPPIPGRADYIHHIADLLGNRNRGKIPVGDHIKCLDIGVGANCIYPIIGLKEYGWSFVGSEIDPVALEGAKKIVDLNPSLKGKVELRFQANSKAIFEGVIKNGEHFDLSVCNPPFHASLAEAQADTLRKLKNLSNRKSAKPVLNFGGQQRELWCEGGEVRFVGDMISESQRFPGSCLWFSTLVSKESNLKNIYEVLRKVGVTDIKTISMGQGNKISRIVAWTFLGRTEQEKWVKERWEPRLDAPKQKNINAESRRVKARRTAES